MDGFELKARDRAGLASEGSEVGRGFALVSMTSMESLFCANHPWITIASGQ